MDERVAAVFLQQPNFLGAVEDLAALAPAAKRAGGLLVTTVDAPTLGILRPPGDFGADVALGEGQPLGNRLDFGGPSFGFFAAREEHIRRMPGRIAGETTDVDGRRGFVLTLQTREQHIRREKATSNICTSQQLNALAGVIYMSWLGRRGIVELGELMAQRTAYARERLAAVEGVGLLHEQPVVREFALRARGAGEGGAAPLRRAGRERRLRARRRVPGVRGRPAGRDHRAPLARGHRPAGRACWAPRSPRSGKGCGGDGVNGTPMQRDPVVTIFERSVEGRRAAQLPRGRRAGRGRWTS